LLLEITFSKAIVTKDWKYLAVRFPERITKQFPGENRSMLNQEGSMFSKNNPDGKLRARYHADQIYPAYFERDQLYFLKNDPNEQKNLFNTSGNQEIQKKMQGLLKEYVEQFPHSFGEFNIK